MNFLDRFTKWILMIGLFLLPLVSSKYLYSPYEIPKVWLVSAFAEILTVLCLVNINVRAIRLSRVFWLPISLFAVLFISSLLNGHIFESWTGNTMRLDGLLTLAHLIALSLTTSILFKREWARDVAQAGAAGSILVALLNLCNVIGFGNPNILAGYLSVTLPLTYYAMINATGKSKVIWILGILIQAWSIIMTGSWGGILGLFVFTILIVIKKWNWKTILLVITTGLCFASLSIAQDKSRWLPNEAVGESRVRILTKGVIAVVQKPIIGWGWAEYSTAFKQVDWPMHYDTDAYVDRAHSSLLEMAVAGGVVGLAIYIWIIFSSLKTLYARNDLFSRYIFITLIIYLIHSQTNVTSVAEELIMWLCIGIANSA